MQRRHALDFNTFDFLRRDELGLSEVIRWMLDPAASHGQIDSFLCEFRDFYGIKGEFSTASVVAETEISTHSIEASRRRMDVHLRCGDFILAIENKPYAGWQENQVRDYLMHLEQVAKGRHCLVVLKRDSGLLPDDQLSAAEVAALCEEGRLVDSDYQALAHWVRACERICVAPRVRAMLGEFSEFIDREFGKGGGMAETRFLIEAIRDDPTRRRSALELIALSEALLDDIFANFVATLREVAAKQHWLVAEEIEGSANLSKTAGGLTIDFGHPEFLLAFVADWEDWTPYFGVLTRKADRKANVSKETSTALSRALGPSERPGWRWPWWRWMNAGDVPGVDPEDFASIWEAIGQRDQLQDWLIQQCDLARQGLISVGH